MKETRRPNYKANTDIPMNRFVTADLLDLDFNNCVFYLLDPRSSSDEALFIAAGTPEASPSEEE